MKSLPALVLVVLVVAGNVAVLATPAHPACGAYNLSTVVPVKPAVRATCQKFSPVLADGSLSFCHGLVSGDFYLPDGYSQVTLEKQAASLLTSGNPALDPNVGTLLVGLLPARCTLQIKKSICLAVFQKCDYIDPYYLDNVCPLGSVCQTCGSPDQIGTLGIIRHPQTPNVANPGYGSVCVNPATGQKTSNASHCIVGPGKYGGWGNIGYASAAGMHLHNESMVDEFCTSRNMVWVEKYKSCMVAIPRSPCKGSVCDPLSEMFINGGRSLVQDATQRPNAFLKPVCPVVTFKGKALLQQYLLSGDEYLIDQVNNVTAQANSQGIVHGSLLSLLGLLPSCVKKTPDEAYFVFGKQYSGESVASRDVSRGKLIQYKATVFNTTSSKCHCVTSLLDFASDPPQETSTQFCNPDLDDEYCTYLKEQVPKCLNAPAAKEEAPFSALAFTSDFEAEMHPMCKKAVEADVNQPPKAFMDLLNQGFDGNAAKAFYLPSQVGLPPLVGQGVKQAVNSKGQALCSNVNAVTGALLTGSNSPECVFNQVTAGADAVPGFFKGKCRAAFLDFVCGTAHMKLEFKQICLNPDGNGGVTCGASDVTAALSMGSTDHPVIKETEYQGLPFLYALPRFPSQEMCQAVHTECADFKEFLRQQDVHKLDAFNQAVNCGMNVTQTCRSNVDGWNSSVWSCDSPFNSYKAYPPAGSVQFLDVAGLFTTYLAYANINASALASWGSAQTTSPALNTPNLGGAALQEFCACPAPLLVPLSASEETLLPGVCCQQACLGHMWTNDIFSQWLTLHDVIGALSLAGSFFVFITWASFKAKRTQGLTMWFSSCSLIISVCMFLIPEHANGDPRDPANKVWCQTPTTPSKQADGGLCLFQGIVLTYFAIAACMWWFCQSVDLFYRIVLSKRHIDHHLKWYHLASWGIPCIHVIVYLSLGAYGYQPNQVWCFLKEWPGQKQYQDGLDLGLFYGTIVAIWAIGTILMFGVLFKIWKITSKSADIANNSNIMKKLAVYRTPALFVAFFVYYWISVFGWRFDFAIKEQNFLDGGVAWATCLLTNYANGIKDPAHDPSADVSMLAPWGVTNGTGCGTRYPARLTEASLAYVQVIIVSQGVFVFLIYGAKLENFNLWRERLHLTSKKYDTTGQGSSTDQGSSTIKKSFFRIFSGGSFSGGTGSRDQTQHGSQIAMIGGGLKSGEFAAVDEIQRSEAMAAKVQQSD